MGKYAKREYRVTFTIEQDVTVEEPVEGADKFEWETEAESKAERLLRESIENGDEDLEGYITKTKWLRMATALAEKKRKKAKHHG